MVKSRVCPTYTYTHTHLKSFMRAKGAAGVQCVSRTNETMMGSNSQE